MSDRPSLLENESRGGDTAESGFVFQTGVIMASLPRWLAYEGFSEIIREAIGDTEVAFFRPSGLTRELLEAKNHRLTPVPFWKEIERFRQIDSGSPGTYSWFTLASQGISDDLKPLVNGLRRVRDPYGFYEGSTVREHSYKEYVSIVENFGKAADDADFLFDRVLIDHEWAAAQSHSEALFNAALCKWHPHCADLSAREVAEVFKSMAALVAKRKAQTISRKELLACIPGAKDNRVLFNTLNVPAASVAEIDTSIKFDWHKFFDQMGYPAPELWHAEVVGQLRATRDWILKARDTRRIYLKGARRLSTSVALGFTFSSVAGFDIDLEYKAAEVWSTDAHTTTETPAYPWQVSFAAGEGEGLVVTIGVIREVANTVQSAANGLGLIGLPKLDLYGNEALVSAEQVNRAVRDVKNYVTKTLRDSGASRIHLFFAGPAHLALFLGHRLNATAPITCYEFVPPGGYVETCSLR